LLISASRGVVVGEPFARSGHHRLEAGRLGTGSPPTSSGARSIQPDEGRVAFQPKLAISVSKVTRSPTCVKVAPSKSKPSALFGQSEGLASQRNSGLGVDEAADQPGARDRSTHRRRGSPRCGRGTWRRRVAELVRTSRAARPARGSVDPLAELEPGRFGLDARLRGKKSIDRSASTSAAAVA
jgi:hypothetical protein